MSDRHATPTPASAAKQEGVSATEKVSAFIAASRYEDLPAAAITTAKLAILDTLGVTIAGVATSTGQIACDVAKETGSRTASTLIGAGLKVDPATAAFVNGTTGHALDYDDVS